jgi:hypothetical protein
MDAGRKIATWIVSTILAPFGGHDPLISLAPLSLLAGIGMLLVIRRTSNPAAIGKVKNRLMAHLYEMRLFADEPVLVWKAQWGLLKGNVRYLGMMLLPVVVLTIPMILLLAQLDCFYGYLPLQPGQEAIVTVELKDAPGGPSPVLRAPEGIAVETDGVRLEDGRQISWRIRATSSLAGKLQIVFPDETLEKSVDAGSGPRYVSDRRVSSIFDAVWHPAEGLLPPGPVEWIELRYPKATVRVLGLDLHWLVWFVVFSMIAALALKRRFRVTF